MTATRERARVVVLGGGYGGQLAAQALARRTDAAVTLVNDGDRFVQRIRLHQLASGQPVDAPRYTDLLDGTGVAFVDDRVVDLDLAAHKVHLRDGAPLDHDVLVYALGSHAVVPEHAHDVSTPDGAARLAARLADDGVRRVAVVGAGLTGIETATELAETRPDLTTTMLTAGSLDDDLSPRGAAHVRRVAARLGLRIVEHAPVGAVRDGGLVLADGTVEPANAVVWTTGFVVGDLAGRAGLAVDTAGRIAVDAALRSTSHPDVVAVGDAAAPVATSGDVVRMACATALPAAQHAARTVAALLAGREPRPWRFRYAIRCVSLGRRDGLVQVVHSDDRPRDLVVTGRAAARIKEAICVNALRVQTHPRIPTSA
ncbi:NAD(P)/FAD-dependent oxidoreductase [Actinomycetospora sp. TBRC 11914]|uniref:NAD(P)/FAD-dependent oxidoreductase n=1 Tax=Actinomycetospora sp. TBRC 11914 TaxID=2729387 RepID=UPI00145EF598|nr:FAD-dependent oxidoreductase [Actinomycetospora sp. TBRC 11914]NMO90993.1 FAD-dependent oxidoreductase [Actinomycetospora sp. TBRC 11914]